MGMRILLGGVPFGCDNIGDEAILACVVAIFRRLLPDCALTVCTRDQNGTAAKLGVATLPAFGFDPDFPAATLAAAAAGHDWFVWAGATGLSDYPETGCALLAAARQAGLRCILWNVGMNDRLNPAFFQMQGKKLRVARLLQKLTGVNWPRVWEERRLARMRRQIGAMVGACRLVVMRDPLSLEELRRCAPFPDAVSAADSALLQPGCPLDALPWPTTASRERFLAAPIRIALCFSAQNPIRDLAGLAACMERLCQQLPGALFVYLPMNPETDPTAGRALQAELSQPERLLLLRFREPEEVQEAVGACQLAISSRLHLLILSLNRLVPAIGIARGSKVAAFLRSYELPVAGSTDQIDFQKLETESLHLLRDGGFSARADQVRQRQLAALATAEQVLRHTLLDA